MLSHGRPHAFCTRQAHFLKSVCLEIGSVWSSVTLLISWLASNQGTNTTPVRRLVAAAGLDPGQDLAAARFDRDLVAAPQAALGGVVRVHEHDGVREGLVELGHAAGHRAGMPVLEHAAGDQPEVELAASGALGRRLVGEGEDPRLLVGEAVELHARCRPRHRDRGPRGSASASPCRRPPASAGRAPGGRCRRAPGRGRGGGRTRHIPRTGPSAGRSRRPRSRRWRSRPRSRSAGSGRPGRCGTARRRASCRLCSGVLASSSAGQTSSTVNRLLNSTSCHRSERASPGACDQLVPEMGAPLGIAVGTLLLDPHRGRQDQVGGRAW